MNLNLLDRFTRLRIETDNFFSRSSLVKFLLLLCKYLMRTSTNDDNEAVDAEINGETSGRQGDQ